MIRVQQGLDFRMIMVIKEASTKPEVLHGYRSCYGKKKFFLEISFTITWGSYSRVYLAIRK